MLNAEIRSLSLPELAKLTPSLGVKKMGVLGGRKFVIFKDGNKYSFTMQDMLKHLLNCTSKKLNTDDYKALQNLIDKLQPLNENYQVKVNNHGIIKYLFTQLRRIANIGFSKKTSFKTLQRNIPKIIEDSRKSSFEAPRQVEASPPNLEVITPETEVFTPDAEVTSSKIEDHSPKEGEEYTLKIDHLVKVTSKSRKLFDLLKENLLSLNYELSASSVKKNIFEFNFAKAEDASTSRELIQAAFQVPLEKMPTEIFVQEYCKYKDPTQKESIIKFIDEYVMGVSLNKRSLGKIFSLFSNWIERKNYQHLISNYSSKTFSAFDQQTVPYKLLNNIILLAIDEIKNSENEKDSMLMKELTDIKNDNLEHLTDQIQQIITNSFLDENQKKFGFSLASPALPKRGGHRWFISFERNEANNTKVVITETSQLGILAINLDFLSLIDYSLEKLNPFTPNSKKGVNQLIFNNCSQQVIISKPFAKALANSMLYISEDALNLKNRKIIGDKLINNIVIFESIQNTVQELKDLLHQRPSYAIRKRQTKDSCGWKSLWQGFFGKGNEHRIAKLLFTEFLIEHLEKENGDKGSFDYILSSNTINALLHSFKQQQGKCQKLGIL